MARRVAASEHAAGASRRATPSARSPTRSARIVLTRRDAGRLVARRSASRFALLDAAAGRDRRTCSSTGIGIWGNNIPVGWGVRHHQLRLVDRHRPRRHADLGDPAAVPAEVAHVDQPLRRGDDAVRRRLRRACSRCSTLGRPWFAYWLLPVSRTRWALWPQFRSPLIWDVFAVSTYATVSLLFWYVGLIPDLATLRDRAEQADRADRLRHAGAGLARLGAPLAPLRDGVPAAGRPGDAAGALGAHGRVSFDFASSIMPGWHTTIFPPYFVAGAIYSGFAMVLTLAIPLRHVLRPRGLHHRCGTSRTWPRSCWRPA